MFDDWRFWAVLGVAGLVAWRAFSAAETATEDLKPQRNPTGAKPKPPARTASGSKKDGGTNGDSKPKPPADERLVKGPGSDPDEPKPEKRVTTPAIDPDRPTAEELA